MWSAVREWETECENRGIAIGEARGERVGLFKGIISTCRDFGISEESALKTMTQQYGLSLDEARRYVKQYW